MERKLTCGSILKPLPTVAGRNLPTFGVMIPQESEIRAGGSINENLLKKNKAKAAHSRKLRLLILEK